MEHGFAIYQNLWIWNGFYLDLELSQGVAVCYVVLVLLANIWTCIRSNQTSIRFAYAPLALETYLKLLADDHHLESDWELDWLNEDPALNLEQVK